jgi:uncharacterized membrane protein YkvI
MRIKLKISNKIITIITIITYILPIIIILIVNNLNIDEDPTCMFTNTNKSDFSLYLYLLYLY